MDSGAPQIRITPDLIALARAGVSVREFSMAVDVFNDGANVIQVPINGELIDMVVSGKDAENLTTNTLKDIPIVTKFGNVLRVEQLAKIEVISAPEQIRRLGGRQAISIRLRPTEELSLEDVVNVIDDEILPTLPRICNRRCCCSHAGGMFIKRRAGRAGRSQEQGPPRWRSHRICPART